MLKLFRLLLLGIYGYKGVKGVRYVIAAFFIHINMFCMATTTEKQRTITSTITSIDEILQVESFFQSANYNKSTNNEIVENTNILLDYYHNHREMLIAAREILKEMSNLDSITNSIINLVNQFDNNNLATAMDNPKDIIKFIYYNNQFPQLVKAIKYTPSINRISGKFYLQLLFELAEQRKENKVIHHINNYKETLETSLQYLGDNTIHSPTDNRLRNAMCTLSEFLALKNKASNIPAATSITPQDHTVLRLLALIDQNKPQASKPDTLREQGLSIPHPKQSIYRKKKPINNQPKKTTSSQRTERTRVTTQKPEKRLREL